MNLSAMKQAATRTLSLGTLVAKKHAPVIMTTTGIVGVVTSTVLACRATLKLDEIVTNASEYKQLVHSEFAETNLTEKEKNKQLTFIFLGTSRDILKLYGPAITMGVASLACIAGAQGIMHRRNVALAAAYKTVEEGFSAYRRRVVEELGEEKDREFRLGSFKTIDVDTRDEKTGEMVTVKAFDPNQPSAYARFFDEYNSNWTRDANLNFLFVKSQQNYANDLLKSRGHLFLNEVYDMLGMEHSQAGAIVGWIIGENSDNYVDFGIFDFGSEMSRAFVNGQERSLLLDFNVDGVIFDRLPNLRDIARY